MGRKVQHNTRCFACGLEKPSNFLGYDIATMKTYCLKNCDNPGATGNIDLIPVTDEDLKSEIVKNFPDNVQETFNALLGKVASVRLQPAHIMHILKIAERDGLEKIQHTLVNIIEADMKARNVDYVQLTDTNFTHLNRPKAEEKLASVEQTPDPEQEEEVRLQELEERQAEENRKAEIPKEERDETEDDEWEI